MLTLIDCLCDIHYWRAGSLLSSFICVFQIFVFFRFSLLAPTRWWREAACAHSGAELKDHTNRQNWTGREGMDTRGGGGSAGLGLDSRLEGKWSNWSIGIQLVIIQLEASRWRVLYITSGWAGGLKTGVAMSSYGASKLGGQKYRHSAEPRQLTVLCHVEVVMEVEDSSVLCLTVVSSIIFL